MTPGWMRHMRHTIRLMGHRRLAIILALAVSWLGLWAHELYRVPTKWGLTLDGSLPLLAIAAALLVWWLAAPNKHTATYALLVYGLINGVGAVLTVLPLSFLPFAPEQTAGHYVIHVIYATCQAPLCVLCMVALSAGKQPMTKLLHVADAGAGADSAH
jgi:hypothetical protein